MVEKQGDSVGFSAGRICAIHQPNFFPWLGYFDKIRRADAFVILDEVDYPKSGSSMGSWVNRVRIAIQGQPAWIRCPVRREHGTQRIRAVRVDDRNPWRDKLVRTLAVNYRQAPVYDKAMTLLEPLLRYQAEYVAEYNINAIIEIASAMGLQTCFHRQCELGAKGSATSLLIEIVKSAGCDTYLTGGGAAGYQDDEAFARAGVGLDYQNYTSQPYAQSADFLPGLSVIDFLMLVPDWQSEMLERWSNRATAVGVSR